VNLRAIHGPRFPAALDRERGLVELERRILTQNRLLELLKLPAGFDAKLVDEDAAAFPVDGERLGLTTTAVERQHQLLAGALAQGLGLDERLKLRDEGSVPTEGQLSLDPLLERFRAQLLQAQPLHTGEGFARKLGERRPAPEGERLPEHVGRASGVTACPLDQTLEAAHVEPLRIELEEVAGWTAPRHVSPERFAQARNVHLHRLLRLLRRPLPERLDQPLCGDDLVHVYQQEREQTPLLRTPERQRDPVLPGLERTEDPKLHSLPSPGHASTV
jgi:hypothetical protein